MSIQTIYTRLVAAGLSPVGACALMGNMQDESAMRANNVQDGYGYTDADYTARVDAGQLDFIDGIGYGLCQWTYGGRKLNLLAYARSRGLSVGDENMQVSFCIQELRTEYPALWLYLCDCTGLYEAAERICKEYERPAETVINVKERASYANQFYMTLSGLSAGEGLAPPVVPEAGMPAPDGTGRGELSSPAGAQSAPLQEESYWPPRVLAYSMYGPDVVALQGLLIAHGYSAGITGSFDSATRLQTMAFQAEQGLVGDGIAGPLTWAALCKRG